MVNGFENGCKMDTHNLAADNYSVSSDSETLLDEMERLNRTFGKNETFTLSPPQDVPVKDTGMEYTPKKRVTRGKSRSFEIRKPEERRRVEKKRFSMPPVPSLNLEPSSARSFNMTEGYLNANQNSAFVSYSRTENQGAVSGGDQLNPSAASSREKHGASFADCLFDMWQTQRMCDVVLKAEGREFPAHRLAIAAHSQGFSNKFCASRSTADICQIPIPNCSLEAVQEVLKFVYTAEINLTMENVGAVLNCARYLGISDVQELAKQILLKCYPENALEVMNIARKHELLDIFSNVYDYICKNFLRVVETSTYLGSSPSEVCRLLADDNLNVELELDVFNAALKWLDYNKQDRMRYVKDIFGAVRFVHITPEDVVTHIESRIGRSSECKDIIMDVFRFQALKYSGSTLTPNDRLLPSRKYHPPNGGEHSLVKRKLPGQDVVPQNNTVKATPVLKKSPIISPSPVAVMHSTPMESPPRRSTLMVAIGGIDPFRPTNGDSPSRLVTEYNPYSNNWDLLTRLPDARHHHGAVVLDDHIFIIGGSLMESTDPWDMSNPTDICYRYDPRGNYWTRIASMKHRRMYHAVTVLGGVLYAVGGQNENGESLPFMEFYNPDTDLWGDVCPMNEAKIGAAASGHRGMVYVVGGFLETEDEKIVLGNVECFDPRRNRWLCKNALPSPRCHAGMVEVNGTLYLVGGSTFYNDTDAITSLDSVLRLDDEHDRWDLILTLRVPRHDAGIAAIGTHIYIVGGVTSSDNHALADVEVCDVAACEWVEGVDWLNQAALGISCCTLEPAPVA